MFRLTPEEFVILKSQFVISSWGGVRKMPYAFTEQGVAMLSGLLNSDIAIEVNISIMRAFVAMRNYLVNTTTVTAELAELRASIELLRREGEDTLEALNDLSEDTRRHIDNLYDAIGALSVSPPAALRRPIGYRPE